MKQRNFIKSESRTIVRKKSDYCPTLFIFSIFYLDLSTILRIYATRIKKLATPFSLKNKETSYLRSIDLDDSFFYYKGRTIKFAFNNFKERLSSNEKKFY